MGEKKEQVLWVKNNQGRREWAEKMEKVWRVNQEGKVGERERVRETDKDGRREQVRKRARKLHCVNHLGSSR